jgi:hypothetical protein
VLSQNGSRDEWWAEEWIDGKGWQPLGASLRAIRGKTQVTWPRHVSRAKAEADVRRVERLQIET